MDIQIVKDRILEYFIHDFDHDLLSDRSNNPFIFVSLLNASNYNPHGDSFRFYLTEPGKPAVHIELTTSIMATALALEAKYLLIKPSIGQPIIDIAGYTRGIPAGKNEVILITVITNPDDAQFVCQSIIHELQIIIDRSG